jgi:hypothetical protein
MRPGIAVLLLSVCLPLHGSENLDRILARLAEEAEVLSHAAPSIIGREVLNQRSLKPRRHFRVRVGAAALKPLPQEYQTRQVVSEYGFSALKDNPEAFHEMRQVISVDGRSVRTPEKARETLILGMTSGDDRRKMKLLQEFEKYGLIGAVMDFGQVLTLFNRRNLANYQFTEKGSQLLGPERTIVLGFRQVSGPEPVTFFEGREIVRQRLEGSLWVRESDLLPLKIVLTSERTRDDRVNVSEGSVEYAPSRFAVLLPVSVVYRDTLDGTVVTESRMTYSDFRRFGADSEIKFEVDPSSP